MVGRSKMPTDVSWPAPSEAPARTIPTLFSRKIPSILESVQSQLQSATFPIVPLGREYPTGHLIERHRHVRAQLVYASRGVMRVDTPSGLWIVPPVRAVWIPAGVDHEISVSTNICMRTLFLDAELSRPLPRECRTIEVSPLLRELILRIVEMGNDASCSKMVDLAGALLIEEMNAPNIRSLHLPLPRDPRLVRVCRNILADPADNKSCAQWGETAGASVRTLERLFQKETGLSFGAWRRQARLLASLEHLAAGKPITNVALDMGYRSPSAFTAMFRRSLGRPPSDMYDRDG